MKNIAPGLSLKKYKGNKHEQGGIMVNALGNKTKDINKAVAEVEGGEYNYRYNPSNPKDNYILSEQLGIANMAKQADRFKNNDRISYNTRNNLLNKSVKLNEVLKAQQEKSQMQMQQAALGGMLKKYVLGGDPNKTKTPKSFRHIGEFGDSLTDEQYKLIKNPEQFNKDMMNWGKPSTTPVVTPVTTPVINPVVKSNTNQSEIKLGTNTNPKLLNLTKIPTTTPKTTAEAVNTGLKLDEKSMTANVNDLTKLTKDPILKSEKSVKDITSGLSGIASAFGPIGQGVGAAMQLAPYAIDLGKAMFDKTSVQDLQTQGSAMRLPNTTYAKNGGKLNVKPLPKYILGGIPDDNMITENKEPIIDPLKPFGLTLTKDLISAKNNLIPRMQKIGDYSFDSNLLYPASQAIQLQANTQGDYTNNKVFMTPDFKTVIKNNDGSYRFFNPQSVEQQTQTTTPVTTTGNNKGKSKSTPVVNNNLSASDIRIREAFKTGSNTLTTLPLPTTIKSNKPGVNNLTTLDVKKEMNIAKRAGLNVTPKSSNSESSKLFKAGQNKQKLSEALMYGMAALPSEQIKTITPDYGRGDDAMSRMGLSTEPIRQEMMQGANKALELSRSQVGTAGQLQSRGQSIMSNVGSQLAQSQLQQQQYLNQLRGALAQREDTKSNVLAQSELTAREVKSAERAAKLDQLNNAISQTSAIGAGTMEQASKMSTIENENERFKRNQDFIRSLANQGVAFKVDEQGNIVFDNKTGSSNIKQADLSNPNKSVVKDNSIVPVTPKEHVVKQGEGLNAIAAQYKIPVDKLLKLNNLKIGDTIQPNQKLKIE